LLLVFVRRGRRSSEGECVEAVLVRSGRSSGPGWAGAVNVRAGRVGENGQMGKCWQWVMGLAPPRNLQPVSSINLGVLAPPANERVSRPPASRSRANNHAALGSPFPSDVARCLSVPSVAVSCSHSLALRLPRPVSHPPTTHTHTAVVRKFRTRHGNLGMGHIDSCSKHAG
jgi:hypothetical protein